MGKYRVSFRLEEKGIHEDVIAATHNVAIDIIMRKYDKRGKVKVDQISKIVVPSKEGHNCGKVDYTLCEIYYRNPVWELYLKRTGGSVNIVYCPFCGVQLR